MTSTIQVGPFSFLSKPKANSLSLKVTSIINRSQQLFYSPNFLPFCYRANLTTSRTPNRFQPVASYSNAAIRFRCLPLHEIWQRLVWSMFLEAINCAFIAIYYCLFYCSFIQIHSSTANRCLFSYASYRATADCQLCDCFGIAVGDLMPYFRLFPYANDGML